MSRGFDISFARDGSVRFLPWIVALMVYLAGLALAGALLLDSALSDWNRSLSGVMTVELPPAATRATDDADVGPVVALLQATPGVASVKLLPRTEVAKLVEPWLGTGQTIGQLALPRLIDVRIDPAHRPDFAALRVKLATAAPGALVDDARLRFDRLFDLGLSIEMMTVVVLVLIGMAAVLTTIFATQAGLAVHQNVIETLHILGARDSYIAQQFARQALGLGLRGGLIGLVLAAGTLALLGHAASGAAILGPGLRLVPAMTLLPWQWSLLVFVPIAATAIAYFTALATVHGALARMP
jgi:cell division transport system permease protein